MNPIGQLGKAEVAAIKQNFKLCMTEFKRTYGDWPSRYVIRQFFKQSRSLANDRLIKHGR